MRGGGCVPLRVHTIVISTQHDETVTLQQLRDGIMEKVVKVTTPDALCSVYISRVWNVSLDICTCSVSGYSCCMLSLSTSN